MRAVSCLAVVLVAVLTVPTASAQYAEVPRPLPVPSASIFGGSSPGWFTAATQIDRRLFVAGTFTRLSPPTGSAVVVDLAGHYIPGAFPYFAGTVTQIVADSAGGWLVVGDFVSVNGRPIARFARVAPDRTVDERYRVVADGAIAKVALAHGRIYLAGDFTAINGAARRGLAALDAVTGSLSGWGAGFDAGGGVRELSFSSVGVYVAGGPQPGHLWGLDAATGRVLFDRPGFVSAVAASSARVYVGGLGFERPVWAVHPFTGEDTDWIPGLTFEYVPATYGWDATQIGELLLDGGRLYIAGRFRTADGRGSLTAVEAGGGRAAGWWPAVPGPTGSPEAALYRVGPAIVANLGGASFGVSPSIVAFDVATAATIPFQPDVVGAVLAVASAPEGVVVVGSFNGSGGVDRGGLAAIDLDTGEVEPWTSAVQGPPFNPIIELATDGTWLFARTEGTLNGSDALFFKIDPVTGAVAAQRALPSITTRMRVAGGEILVSTQSRTTFAAEVGVITIADWSYAARPVTFDGSVSSLDAIGDAIYLAGRFTIVNGQSRPAFAAVHRVTGAVLPWRPAADSAGGSVRTSSGRVWVAGGFSRVGGQRRRGLAELDPATGLALPWNPDVAGVLSGGSLIPGVNAIEIGADGNLYAVMGTFLYSDERAVAAGQLAPPTLAYSTTTGRRLPWRPSAPGMIAVQPDCLLTAAGCLPRAIPAPTDLHVTQSGAALALSWALPASPARTGVRLEVGSRDGRADLYTLDLPANQQAFSATVPPGSYFARVRALAGVAGSITTPDVSFAVGRAAAPLDFTAIAAGPLVTFAWQPPSTGAPTRYELEAGAAEGRRDLAIAIAGAAATLTVNAPIGRFWTRLVAVNDSGRSAVSNEAFIDNTPRNSCSTSPPQNLVAAVVGRTVTLTWNLPADGSEDPPRIVAGSAPGASDIASLTAAPYTTSFAVAAPPGTYYVRLVVGCFNTASSNEVQVVVP
jgi:hypothetical protein